ncbi:MAG: AAA family ATPase [Planctomycetes bacterium]|nr:AAA family ATPase [Planctomycetota bacterium]
MNASERHETHLSDVTVAGAFAWKRKKAVRFGFVDFSTLPLRDHFCREEVRVNRRLAPTIYLGVAPLLREASSAGGALALGPLDSLGGVALTAAEEADYRAAAPWPPEKTLEPTLGKDAESAAAVARREIVDWCVVMRRLPAEGMAERLVARGELAPAELVELAGRLARFHRESRVPLEEARAFGAAGAAKRFDAVLAERRVAAAALEGVGGAPLLPPAIARATELQGAAGLRAIAARLEARAAAGRVVDGHGDLHCGNLCRIDARLLPFDALEFDAGLRRGDAAYDLSFLTMDLRRRGAPALARTLQDAYVAAADDREVAALLPWHEQLRALIRGNVAALRAAQLQGEARAQAIGEARAAVAFAVTRGWRAPLLAMCGRQGSGKSRVARALAARLDAVVLEADVVRKERAGLPIDQPSPQERRAELYQPAAIAAVYAELLVRARRHLERGKAVVLDATYGKAAWRGEAAALARALQRPFLLLHRVADDATVERRLLRRAGEVGHASDADLAVERAARGSFEPPIELPAAQLLELPVGDDLLDDPRDALLAGPLGAVFVEAVARISAS